MANDKTIVIQKTKDYDKFGDVQGNRDIDQRHYADLATQIARNNLLYANPIIVNDKMEVIDGQHRLKVARDNNFDIYYVVVDNAGLQDIMELNSHTKKWTIVDFVNSYIKVGNENYKILKDFADNYNLGYTVAAELLGGRATKDVQEARHGIWNLHTTIKTGRFQVKWLKEATDVMEHVIAFTPFYKSVVNDRYFIRAIRQLYLGGKEEMIKRLEQRLIKTGKEIEREYNVKDYLRQFEQLLNFHIPEANHIRLF